MANQFIVWQLVTHKLQRQDDDPYPVKTDSEVKLPDFLV